MDPFDTYATAANIAAGMSAEQAATVTANTYGDQTMIAERTYRIEITEAAVANGNTIEPGSYWVRIPGSYDPDEVTGPDILHDGAITLVGPGDVSPDESCDTLDELLDLLRTDPGGMDWTDLRTFGGEAPADTSGVWSWDEGRVLVGDGLVDVRIEDREGEA